MCAEAKARPRAQQLITQYTSPLSSRVSGPLTTHLIVITIVTTIVITMLLGCEPPPSQQAISPCDVVDCQDRVCAVVDDVAVCLCPPDRYDDGEGRCLEISRMNDQGRGETQDALMSDATVTAERERGVAPSVDVSLNGPSPEYRDVGGRDLNVGTPDLALYDMGGSTEDMWGIADPDAETGLSDAAAHDPTDMTLLDMSAIVNDLSFTEDPCDPNPCLDLHRGVCEETAVSYVCRCDSGFREELDMSGELSCVPLSIGACEESHLEGDRFEPDECLEEATLLQVDVPQVHSVQPEDDEDWYRIDPIPSHIYRFEVTRADLPGARLSLYESAGTRVLQSQTLTDALTHELSGVDPYYLRVQGLTSRQVGNYGISLTDLGLDDHGDLPESATLIEVDVPPHFGEIETPGDDDWFSFEASSGRIYRFTLTRDTLSASYLYLYRPDGQSIARSYSDPESVAYEVSEDGRWYVRVRHLSSAQTGSYTLEVSDEGVDDHADEITPVTELTPIIDDGSVVEGMIETFGDVDCFVLEAQARHIYLVTLTPLDSSDTSLDVYDPAGTQRAFESDEELYYKTEGEGSWVLRVRQQSLSRVGGYLLSVLDLGVDDHADIPEEATVITPGEPVQGDIESDRDDDYFAFDALSGHIYRAEVILDTLSDSYLYFYAPDGRSALYSGSAESTTQELNEADRYLIRVRHALSNRRGTYELRLTDLGLDDHADTPLGASLLAAGAPPLMGTLETRGDVDVFELTLTQGQVYRIETNGVDVRVTVYEGDGETRVGSTGGDYLDVNVEMGGRYFVEVRADSFTATGDYTISVID